MENELIVLISFLHEKIIVAATVTTMIFAYLIICCILQVTFARYRRAGIRYFKALTFVFSFIQHSTM